MNTKDIRRNYNRGILDENQMNKDPMVVFDEWLELAIKSEELEPTAMNLSTINEKGRPSCRIVLLKNNHPDKGFGFFTNYKSQKGSDIKLNPYASLNFFWPILERQVRVEGKVEKTHATYSDQYFDSRPIESKISAIASPQSKIVKNRLELEQLYKKIESKEKLIRPQNWGGYILIPDKIEFWQGRPGRLHDRIIYQIKDDKWIMNRLAP